MTPNNYRQPKENRTILKAIMLVIFAAGTLSVSAQNIKLAERTQTREQTLGQIKTQTGYEFLYNPRDLDIRAKVNFGKTELPLTGVLSKLTEGTGLTYTIDNKVILIFKADKTNAASRVTVKADRAIAGTVTDSGGALLEGVTVEILGTQARSATTFANGRFQIEGVTPGNHIIKFTSADGSAVRFREVNVPQGRNADITVELTGQALATIPAETTVSIEPQGVTKTTSYFVRNDTDYIKHAFSDEARTEYNFTPVSRINKEYLPKAALKTNLLYDATGTLNIAAEIALAPKWTLEIPVGYNPFIIEKGGVNRIAFVQPEVRYWFCQRFEKHFVGLHGLYGQFNIGEVSFLTRTFEEHRYKGWGAGVGVSYGYHLPVAKRWALEFTVGAGYVWLKYDKFRCYECDEYIGKKGKHYFGPTKAAINLVFMLK